jgi:protocatechuate 3,4-dioxygenase beta subunit
MKMPLVFALTLICASICVAQSNIKYAGAVVDAQGRPVAGATVDCYYSPAQSRSDFWGADEPPEFKQQLLTDSNGAFVVSSSPGTTLVVVKKAGFAPVWHNWMSGSEATHPSLILAPPTTLAGTVLDENARPVAGARVWVSDATIAEPNSREAWDNQLSGKVARDCFSSTTDAQGLFRIENFPPGAQADLSTSKDGNAQQKKNGRWNFRSGQKDIELVLGPAGNIEGKVVVQETGRALAGVKIQIMSTSGEGRLTEPAVSGSDGTFRIPDVESAVYNIMPTVPGSPPEWVPDEVSQLVTVRAGNPPGNVLIQASKGALVQVTVVDTNSLEPLADVAVSSGRSTVYTDTSGRAQLRVPVGRNYFSAKKDWFRQNTTIEIQTNAVNQIQFALTPAPVIAGTVREASGVPVPGAIVSFHPGAYPDAPDYIETTTDNRGRYELKIKISRENEGWEGIICPTNCVLARSLERNLATIWQFDRIPTNLDLTLQPGITFSGAVTDTTGAPITNAVVNIGMEYGRMMPGVLPSPMPVDAQGAFSIPALPQGRQYSISDGITAKGYGTGYKYVLEKDTHTNRFEFPTFVLKRANLILAGKVLDLDGNPLPGANVEFGGQGQHLWTQTRSDRHGNFIFDEVCDGDVHLHANALVEGETLSSGNGTGITARGGDTNIIIQLTSGAGNGTRLRTTGTVFDPAGEPVAYVDLHVLNWSAGYVPVRSDPDGKYVIHWQSFPPGAGHVLLARDYTHNLAVVSNLDETDTQLDLHLQKAFVLSGTVLDVDGRPIPNAGVELGMLVETIGQMGALEGTGTQTNGAFSFYCLPQKGIIFSLTIKAQGYNTEFKSGIKFTNGPTDELHLPSFQLKPASRL